MSRRVTFEGKSVEDAVEEASRQLGHPIGEGDYRVVENRKGFWGMNRKVIIDVEAPEGYVAPEPAPAPPAAEPEAERVLSSADPVAWARGLVGEIVQGVGLSLTLDVRQDGEVIRVELAGADEGRLQAQQGELLSSIQYLVGKIASKKFGPAVQVEVDAGGFRERRTRELVELAKKTAAAVRESGRRALLPPLAPAERRQVHLALADEPDVTTESEGEGFKKRVAVFLRKNVS